MFITFSFRIIVLSIGYYASVGGEDTSQAKDFGIGGVTSWLDGGVDNFPPGLRPEVIHSQFLVCRPSGQVLGHSDEVGRARMTEDEIPKI